jgi:hypothetical protein
MKLLRVDFYVVESLMRDLVGHDKKPSAFIVYLYLWSRLSALRSKKVQTSHQSIADDTGLSKSAVQMAVRHLLRRRLVRSESASPTSTPTYSLLRPWRRSASRKLVSAALLFLFSIESIAQSAVAGNITGTMRRGSAAVPAAIVVISDRDGRIRRTREQMPRDNSRFRTCLPVHT